MNTDQTRPEHGSKDPETGLFCWRYSGTFRWVTLEKYEELLDARARYARNRYRRKKAAKKSKVVSARSPVSPNIEKNILALHAKGKTLFYISSIYNMKISKIKEVIEKANP